MGVLISKYKWFILIGLILIGILIAYIIFQNNKVKRHEAYLRNPSSSAQTEKKTLIEKVSRLTNLPEDEHPIIATVEDVDALKGQPFFDKAKNGFIVLTYTKEKRRFLYDPVNNKIVAAE